MAAKKTIKEAVTPEVKENAENISTEESTEDTIAQQKDEIEQLKALVMQLQEKIANQPQQVVHVVSDGEKVVMRFQAEVADDNVAVFGANGMYGQVTGKRGTVIVPKSEWSRFYTETNRRLIDNRWLIVLSGMTDDERELYNCNYKEGELLDEQAFSKLVDLGDELLQIFPKLCVQHQEMVGRRFIEAWNNGDTRVMNRELIVALNAESKKNYKNVSDLRKRGIFWPIIEEMNKKDAE